MKDGKKITYFVGAGLTKSLEKPGRPIPLMYDFIRVVADYVRHKEEDIILTTLAELENAGAFQATSAEATKLAKIVVGKNPDRSQGTRDAFRRAFCDRPSESIEDLLLRALEVAAGSSDSPGQERKLSAEAAAVRFSYAINRLFSYWIGWEVNWCPLEMFLRRQFANFPLDVDRGNSHTFISFNYDLILDRAIQRIGRDRFEQECWVPSTGYGFPLSYFIDEEPVPAGNGAQSYPKAKPYPAMPSIGVQVLKPHGSLNWLVPHDNARSVTEYGVAFKDGPVFVPLAWNDGQVRYWPSENERDNLIYETPENPHHIGEHVGICILPPLPPAKQPALEFIKNSRRKEEDAVRDADDFYVIGWSMPKTDQDQLDLIRGATAGRRKPIRRVVVVNRDAKPEYFAHVQQTFGVPESKLEIHNAGFAAFAERS